MISYLPLPGGHIMLAERFVDSSFSFALGWTYWYDMICCQCTDSWKLIVFDILFIRYYYIIALPTDLCGASILIKFWDDKINATIWVTCGIVIVVAINLMGAGERFYLMQDCVSGSSLHSHNRHLWRSWIYFCASLDNISFRMTRILMPNTYQLHQSYYYHRSYRSRDCP